MVLLAVRDCAIMFQTSGSLHDFELCVSISCCASDIALTLCGKSCMQLAANRFGQEN